MTVRSLADLAPEVRKEVELYLERLSDGFCAVPSQLAEETLAETRVHFLEGLSEDSTVGDVRELARVLGEPDEYAAMLCEELGGATSRADDADMATPAGRILGMPYDLKAPTAENLRTRLWNPYDPRVFTPRLVGLGWSINFAALAVKAGIIGPDDEDEPFASVPERYLWAAMLLSVLVAVGAVSAVALAWPTLPDQVAFHWGANGLPDEWASPSVALLPLLGLIVVPAAYALWMSLSGRSKMARALVSASASMFVMLGGTIVVVALADTQGVQFGWAWPWVMLVLAFSVPFAMLVVLSRLGRAQEMKRDMGG